MVLVLNMMDVVKKCGICIDVDELRCWFGMLVIEIVAVCCDGAVNLIV